jgi:hypothetical protein
VTINTLPDNVLLEIFNFYVAKSYDEDGWHPLVHVCRSWRCVVFASPSRLNLQLLCTNRRPVTKTLDVWPVFPIVISFVTVGKRLQGMTNIISTLKQHNRVCKIDIDNIPNALLKKFAIMKSPFPALTFLGLRSNDEDPPILPDSFMGGSAPRLQELHLHGLPFPTLRKLLSSAIDLVFLRLWDIPYSDYISPAAMVSSLSALSRLESLRLGFQFPRSRADRTNRHPPLLTRVVLPALASIKFKGDSEYLEDIVCRIDTPLLDSVTITFFNQLLFDLPLLRQFIDRTEIFTACRRAVILFCSYRINVTLFRQKGTADHRTLQLGISSKPLDWQLSSLAQLGSLFLPPFSLEHFGIYEDQYSQALWQDDIESAQWLELLHPYTAVKDLELSRQLVRHVIPALGQLTGERLTEVLPALQTLSLPGPQPSGRVNKAIRKFTAARQLSGRPVAIHYL